MENTRYVTSFYFNERFIRPIDTQDHLVNAKLFLFYYNNRAIAILT